MNYKDKSVLVWDSGIGCDLAVRLAKDVAHVYYFTPYREQQKFIAYAYGQGLVPNMEKIEDFDDYVDRADLFCFLDIGAGGRAKQLRKQGKLVFGGGDGEKFEEHRFKFRAIQKALGLPTQKTVIAKGVSQLRDYIKKNPNQYIKIDQFRGDFESFPAKTYDKIEMDIDRIEIDFGPFKETHEFMVEEFLDSVCEIGVDGFFNGSEWLWPSTAGFECTASYVGRVYDKKEDMPKPLTEIMDKLSVILRKVNYRGCISVEFRVMADKRYFLTDMSMRPAYPLSLAYTEFIKNYTDVIWGVARGEPITPQFTSRYMGCLHISDPSGKYGWERLILDEKNRNMVKLQYACKVGNFYYLTKGQQDVGAIIAQGKTPEEVLKILRGNQKLVESQGSEPKLQQLVEVEEQIRKAKGVGINF